MPTIASIPFRSQEVTGDPIAAPATIDRKYFVRLANAPGANRIYGLSAGGTARFRIYLTSLPPTAALPEDAELRDPTQVQFFQFPDNPPQKTVDAGEVTSLLNEFIPGWYYIRLNTQQNQNGTLTLLTGLGTQTAPNSP